MFDPHRATHDRFHRLGMSVAISLITAALLSTTLTDEDKGENLLLGLSHGHRNVRRHARHHALLMYPAFFATFLKPGGSVDQLSLGDFGGKLDDFKHHLFLAQQAKLAKVEETIEAKSKPPVKKRQPARTPRQVVEQSAGTVETATAAATPKPAKTRKPRASKSADAATVAA
jgi:hypothetical protein